MVKAVLRRSIFESFIKIDIDLLPNTRVDIIVNAAATKTDHETIVSVGDKVQLPQKWFLQTLFLIVFNELFY